MKSISLFIFLFSMLYGNPYVSQEHIRDIEKKYGAEAKERFYTLNKTLKNLMGKSVHEKLINVNDFYNAIPYQSDFKNWHKKDYWATPLEFLGRDRGDCEDYVIAKYFALRYLGVDSKKLYFSYVESLKFRQPHMVLVYFETPKSIPLVLDNNTEDISPITKRRDLIPIYNFNGDTLFLANKKGAQEKLLKKTHKTHKKWDILIQNIKLSQLVNPEKPTSRS